MKILFVCQQYIHSARWINQLKDSVHEIFVFDCLDMPIHEDLLWTTHFTNWSSRKLPKFKGEHFLKKKAPFIYEKVSPILKVTPSEKLIEIIKEIQPDLVHSLEMQSQTYHVFKARKKIDFKWAYFSWGSDMYLYQDDRIHQKRMQKIVSKLDYLFVDNNRDIFLAEKLGFKNKLSGVFPGGGGYHIEEYQQYIKPVSERNLILIKGYHHWAGRALQVLEAIELLVDDIREYSLYVYSAHDVVVKKINKINKKHNLDIQFSSRSNQISHQELLQKFGEAKIAIANNITDGIPNTLLESIILGAFPIQSNPGNVTEDYIENGENGFLINDITNVKEIALLISSALKNEKLLIKAFEKNQKLSKKLEYIKIQKSVLESYKIIEKQ